MSSHEERLHENELRWLKEQEDLVERAWKETTEEVSKVSRPKIQQVPPYMWVEFEKFYVPQVITIGSLVERPKGNFLLGEPYRIKWTAMYLKHTNQTIKDLYIRISSHKRELLEQYTIAKDEYLYIRSSSYERPLFEERLIFDGCSILEVLEKSNNSVDAEQELKISLDKLVQVHQDLLILDNQIPFQVLRILCNDKTRLKKCLQNFLEIHRIEPDRGKEKGNKGTHNGPEEHKVIVDDQQSIEDDAVHLLDYLRRALLKRDLGQIHKEVGFKRVHLLDYLRRALLMRDLGQIHKEGEFKRKSLHLRKYRIGTIRELKAAGIRVKKDPNNTTFYPSFSGGILYLPQLTVDGSTAHIFLNLIAYEMCPDFRNDLGITSYVVFMSSLIDQPEDVKVLRSAGILINELANDKQVADLFNKMDSVLVPETSRFATIRDGIQDHFETKRNKIKMLGWMGEAYETYLRSPWTVIALLAGSLALVLTLIQTWFAIHPKG